MEKDMKLTERIYSILLELWGDQYGYDIRLVSIRPTDGPAKINLIERRTP